MGHSLTSDENIVLDVIFGRRGESRFNRTTDEYVDVAVHAPKLAALHAEVNETLKKMAAAGYAPYEICTFSSARH